MRFYVERTINGLPVNQRQAVRQNQVAPLVAELEGWMRADAGAAGHQAEPLDAGKLGGAGVLVADTAL